MWRNINSRDILGLCLWFMVALVIGWVAYTLMIAREIYQFFRYRLERFEWEDVVRYSLVITLGLDNQELFRVERTAYSTSFILILQKNKHYESKQQIN